MNHRYIQQGGEANQSERTSQGANLNLNTILHIVLKSLNKLWLMLIKNNIIVVKDIKPWYFCEKDDKTWHFGKVTVMYLW